MLLFVSRHTYTFFSRWRKFISYTRDHGDTVQCVKQCHAGRCRYIVCVAPRHDRCPPDEVTVIALMWSRRHRITRRIRRDHTQCVALRDVTGRTKKRKGVIDWLIEFWFGFTSNSTRARSFRRRFPKPVSRLGMGKKLNLTQQTHAFTNQKKCTTTRNKHEKTKVRFSRLLRHPVWKRRGSILKGKDR